MKVPNADRAVVDSTKLRDYLLATSHPVGRFKAVFFGSLGFEAERWHELEVALRKQLLNPSDPPIETGFGRKFAVRGTLEGSSGTAPIVSIWIVLNDEDFPRFVTAYPGDER